MAGLFPQPRPRDFEAAVRLAHLSGSYPCHLKTDLISEELQAGSGNITQVHLVTDRKPSLWGSCAPWRTGVSTQATYAT